MNKKLSSRTIALLALLVAINLILNFFLRLPTPTGFISLVEVGIFLSAWYLGPHAGMIVGGLTGFLIDLLVGYPQWMFFSLLIHGCEGYLFGLNLKKIAGRFQWLISALLGGIVMVSGYLLAGLCLQFLNHAVVQTAFLSTLTEIPGNIIQVIAGGIVARLIYQPFCRFMNRITK
ncbi:ECF transporter S component [Weissella diestrammenae]|uniref:ECF transporter S component n=1 Tax=Weissella diestrammenae TaxID=1162633 RepID=A0A7G9T5J7_9LACO|nr:ECF transporter S component [Weissella diestrammenae]MCM0582199.1 ECF transporter S component [Weissella diestrammenae]QNN75372.1 ECF transporter S component [Weissella diestrammenae]